MGMEATQFGAAPGVHFDSVIPAYSERPQYDREPCPLLCDDRVPLEISLDKNPHVTGFSYDVQGAGNRALNVAFENPAANTPAQFRQESGRAGHDVPNSRREHRGDRRLFSILRRDGRVATGVAQILRNLRDVFSIVFGCWPLLALYAILIVTLLMNAGCATPPRANQQPEGVMKSGELNASADARLDAVIDMLKSVKDKIGQQLFKLMNNQLGLAKEDLDKQSATLTRALAEQQASNENALEWKRKQEAEHTDNIKLRSQFFSPRQIALAWMAGIAMAVAVILRGAALSGGGVVGRVASFLSTAIFTVISFGVAGIQSLFDNLWFRVFQHKAKKQPDDGTEIGERSTDGPVPPPVD